MSVRWSICLYVGLSSGLYLMVLWCLWPATYTAVSDHPAKSLHIYIHIFFREHTVSHAKFSVESSYEDNKGLRSRNLRLHGAFTWRYFRFIIIGQFSPIFSHFRQSAHFSFVYVNRFRDQRRLLWNGENLVFLPIKRFFSWGIRWLQKSRGMAAVSAS